MGPRGKEGLILWPFLLCSSQELGQVRGIGLHIPTACSPHTYVLLSWNGPVQNPHWKLRRLTPSFGSVLAVRLKQCFFRNRIFLFFKIESWKFQVQFEIEFHETSQNFNSFSLFREFLFSSFFIGIFLSDWVEIMQGFTKFNFKLSLKVSAFYLEK